MPASTLLQRLQRLRLWWIRTISILPRLLRRPQQSIGSMALQYLLWFFLDFLDVKPRLWWCISNIVWDVGQLVLVLLGRPFFGRVVYRDGLAGVQSWTVWWFWYLRAIWELAVLCAADDLLAGHAKSAGWSFEAFLCLVWCLGLAKIWRINDFVLVLFRCMTHAVDQPVIGQTDIHSCAPLILKYVRRRLMLRARSSFCIVWVCFQRQSYHSSWFAFLGFMIAVKTPVVRKESFRILVVGFTFQWTLELTLLISLPTILILQVFFHILDKTLLYFFIILSSRWIFIFIWLFIIYLLFWFASLA